MQLQSLAAKPRKPKTRSRIIDIACGEACMAAGSFESSSGWRMKVWVRGAFGDVSG